MKSSLWLLALAASALLCAQQPEQRDSDTQERKSRTSAPARNEASPLDLDKAVPELDHAAGAPRTAPEQEPQFLAFSNYRFGPEDLVLVTVLDSPEFTRMVRVSEAGTIRLPLLKNQIAASGKTSAEIEQAIAKDLVDEGMLRDPSVSVTLRELHSKPVTVTGAVRVPLVFQALRPTTLTEALSRAGGLADTAGSEVIVMIPARDGNPAATLTVSAKSLMGTPDSKAAKSEIMLEGGEEVRVPVAGKVYVLGSVGRPGAVLLNEDERLTLLRALSLAGGPNQNASNKAYLLRPTDNGSGQKQQIAIDLRKLLKRQNPDLPLEANDVLYIPDSRGKRLSEAGMSAAISTLMYTAGAIILAHP